MNGLNFKPNISKILSKMSSEEIATLNSLMETHSNNFTNRSLVDKNNILTTSDKGIGLFNIQLDENTIRTGYLIYNDNICVLLAYTSNSNKVDEFEIDVAQKKYKYIKEFLSTDYLRHELNIASIEAGEVGNIVAKFSVNDIKSLTKEQLDDLEPGDVVNKVTGNAVHSYRVSYKGEGAGQGICLTYSDVSCVETVSYDRSGSSWVYNSTDVTELGESGGTKLYEHSIYGEYVDNEEGIPLCFITTSPSPITASTIGNIKYVAAYLTADRGDTSDKKPLLYFYLTNNKIKAAIVTNQNNIYPFEVDLSTLTSDIVTKL